MILKQLWERYLFKELFSFFCLTLFGIFCFYSLVDYSTHVPTFHSLADALYYYLFQFVKRADILIALTLLLSVLRLLSQLNVHKELVALQAAGISLRRILRPFFLLACFGALFCYVNQELFIPDAHHFLRKFQHTHKQEKRLKKVKKSGDPFHTLYLKDGSKIIYQSYDPDKKIFFDLFWVRSIDDVWRIKTLHAESKPLIGQYVDHLVRNPQGLMEKKESYASCPLESIHLKKEMLWMGPIPLEDHKMSDLLYLALHKEALVSYERAEMLTCLFFKLVMPLLSFLVVIAIAPFCVRYVRQIPYFFLYGAALFALIAFFVFMDALVILGENRILHPAMATLFPFALLAFIFSWRYKKVIL